ncbi:hypothetical protein NP233_g4170 [Leucocoprinus birnbaumii]|uniref:Uncharacterized protein n=1 Tax=Leucocoprinus birnbaumii TaxID=56174 RepID=A0AAD5YXF0_9AGAR|nr:hypothetical protein NP233_g4170 [Leucocoprinus birnbaumii]
MSGSVALTAFPSLVEAVCFLTCTLSLVTSPTNVKIVEQIVLSALSTSPAWLRNAYLILKISSTSPPPVFYAACAEARIDWSDWFFVLGGREFELTIKRAAVSVRVAGIPGQAVVWKQAPPARPSFTPSLDFSEPVLDVQVPIRGSSRPTTSSRTPSLLPLNPNQIRPLRTLAQQLLHSEQEEEEADEIFALISKFGASEISSTPTREWFEAPIAPVTQAPVPTRSLRLPILEDEAYSEHNTSPIASPGTSRSNSPSTSMFSYSSSQESLTSISTASSIVSTSIKPYAEPFVPASKHAPVPRCQAKTNPPVVTNPPKKRVQRYLYQGGQSTTLTGGVMLGATKAPTSHSTSPSTMNSRSPGTRGQSRIRTHASPSFWNRGNSVRV